MGKGIFEGDFTKGFMGGYLATGLIGRKWGKREVRDPNTDPKTQEILHSFLDEFLTRSKSFNQSIEDHLDELIRFSSEDLNWMIQEIDSQITLIFEQTSLIAPLVDSGEYWKALNIAIKPNGAFKLFDDLRGSFVYRKFNSELDEFLSEKKNSEINASSKDVEREKAIEQLERITKLKDSGGISQEEFLQIKEKLIPKIL